MKTETDNFKQMAEAFWRSQVLECRTPEAALLLLERDAGLSRGRAIYAMRRYSPALYNAMRAKPMDAKPVRNPLMSRIRFVGR